MTSGGTYDDGRLEVDDLEGLSASVDTIDLDVVCDESPRASERLSDWLEQRGVLPWVRRHRVITGAVVAVVLIGLGGAWAVAHGSRDLPEPAQIVIRASGSDPHLLMDTTTGAVTGVELGVEVAVAEPPDIGVRLLHLTGPGLRNNTLVETQVDRDHAGGEVPVQAGLDCQSADLAAARASDYGVVVRRTSRDGRTAVDSLRVADDAPLLDIIRAQCFQQRASRQLEIGEVAVRPAPGSVAADLAITVISHGPSTWTHVRVAFPVATSTSTDPTSNAAQPSNPSSVFVASVVSPVVPLGTSVTVAPGHPAVIHARYWPQNCASPQMYGALELQVSAVEGTTPGITDPGGPAVALAVPTPSVDALESIVRQRCGPVIPRALVTSAIVRSGANDASAGTLDLTVAVSAPGSSYVSIASGASDAGLLEPALNPLKLVGGRAIAAMRWRVPTCDVLRNTGLPPVQLITLGAHDPLTLHRSYLLGFESEALDIAVARLCPVVTPTPVVTPG